jgi:hypothetical protein
MDKDFAPDRLCMRYRDIKKRAESEEKKLQLAWLLSDMGPDNDFNKVPDPGDGPEGYVK